MIKAIRKHEEKFFCIGLSHREFQCQCNHPSCTMTLIDSDLVHAYEKLRGRLGLPIKINSAYRCPQHNFEVGGVQLSKHMQGRALDICKTSYIDIMETKDFIHLAKDCGFTFVKEYHSFLHLNIGD